MTDKIVTRMAPSPTGHLHIGTTRAALYNLMYARKHGGTFILRSEDTDITRSTKEFEDEIVEGLRWVGIVADEYYRQSERAAIYHRHLSEIIERDMAYVSTEDSKQKPGEKIEVVRLKNPNKSIVFNDEIRGKITFDTTELGDFVIARSVTDPLYHFAVVVDDFLMDITHVIRGEDHISNTPRQILIQEALGAPRPIYAHLPLLLAPDRSKLSKRHGAVALSEYRSEGFLPEAIVNYLALLGWNPGTDQEIFSIEELVEAFDLSHVQKGGAVFDRDKLIWFNREHIKHMNKTEFKKIVTAWLPKRITTLSQYSEARLEKLLPTIKERAGTLGDITRDGEAGEYDFAFEAPIPVLDMLKWKKDEHVRDILPRLLHVIELLQTLTKDVTPESVKDVLWNYVEKTGKGEVLWPLRVALSGREKSPDPFTIIFILGKEEASSRIKNACDTIHV